VIIELLFLFLNQKEFLKFFRNKHEHIYLKEAKKFSDNYLKDSIILLLKL